MVTPTLIDLSPVELKYYPFMIGLDKCNESCNALSRKTYVPKEIKDITVKAFNMIKNKNEAKTMKKNILYDCKCKFNSTSCNSNQKWYNKICQYKCKNFHKCNSDIADTSVIECDEAIQFTVNHTNTSIINI